MHPLDAADAPPADRSAPADSSAAAVHERLVRRPLRRLQTATVLTGALTAAATAGVLALQTDPGYARSVLESRTLGAEAVSDAAVAEFLTPPWGAPLGVTVVLVLTALLWLGARRPVRAVRPLGTVVVGLGLFTAAFWMVDGGRMVLAGGLGPFVLAAVVGAFVASAVWLFLAHLRSTVEALQG